MKILTGEEAQNAMKWLDAAARVAARSLCERAHCGSVVVKGGEIVGRGFNSPPQENPEFRTCLDEYDIPAGFRHDRTCCIHAEQRAIQDALQSGKDIRGGSIYFVRVNEKGEKTMASDMKCTVCSRAVLDAGLAEFVFYSVNGVRSYPPEEVDRLSYEYKTPRIS